MNFDWNVISAISTAIGSIATAVGVCFGAWQIQVINMRMTMNVSRGVRTEPIQCLLDNLRIW